MRFLNLKRTIPLMKWRHITATISAVAVVICIGSLAVRGLNLGIDFTGGTIVEVSYNKVPPIPEIRSRIANAGIGEAIIQPTGSKEVLIRLRPSEEIGPQLSEHILDSLGRESVTLRRVEFVGPQVGDELFLSGALALIFVMAGIVAYLSIRFKWRAAVGAIIANFHDVLFILGLFSIFSWEFNLPVLAALLAILGYSVNESVVIFDRVRENLRSSRKAVSVSDTIDISITQTWSRTIITHGSTQMAVLAMLFFGGEPLYYFALALTIGIMSSIYSSILIANPVALRLGLSREDFIEQKPNKREADGAVV